jgi:intein/homing endonuclease
MNQLIMPCGCSFNTAASDELPDINIDVYDSEIHPPLAIDIYHIPLDCPKTWHLLTDGHTKGIFQLESHLGRTWAIKLKPESVEELSALVSLIRPGSMNVKFGNPPKSVPQHYCDRKHKLEDVEYLHEALKPILEKTYGIIAYQEESMQISVVLAGFDLQKVDILRKCVAKGSLVYTQNGPKKIEDLCNSKGSPQILTIDNKNKLVYKKIKRVWNTGIQQTYKITCSKGYQICLTAKHQVFTQDGWKSVEALNIYDFIAIPKQYTYKGYATKHISIDDVIIMSYLISEGYHTKQQTKITNSDEWVLNIIKQCLKNKKAETKEYIHKNGCVDIHIKGKYKKWLDQHIQHNKSRYKVIPNEILHNTNGFTQAFVGHYFSAEGSVGKYGLEISSTSHEIILALQALLLRDKIHSGINIHNGTYLNQPYVSYRLYICSLVDMYKFLKTYHDYICPRKLEKLQHNLNTKTEYQTYNNNRFLIPACFIKAATKHICLSSVLGSPCGSDYNKNQTYDRAERLNQIIDSELLSTILNADFRLVQVTGVTTHGQEETYDYEIDDDNIHYGFINGILVHNSIGKKKADIMAKVQAMFMDGCKQTAVVTQEQAEEIFGWIKESQRYSFNKSITPDTLVVTSDGTTKTISDIQIGEKIQCPNIMNRLSYENEYCAVINKFNHGKQDVYEVELVSGQKIKCTMQHKFLCQDSVMRPLYEIIKDHHFILCRTVYYDIPLISERIISIQYIGKIDTMDIEVDNPEHVFYANGIATSNSHGVSYGLISYWTAYLKAHFPQQFYCSYLHGALDKQDTRQEIKELVNHAKQDSNLTMCVPDFRHQRTKPYIKNHSVYFGIDSIKKIGDASLKKIINAITEIKKPIADWTWLDYLLLFSDKISTTSNTAIISSGGLDYTSKSRTEMLYEFEVWNQLTTSEKAYVHNIYNDNKLSEKYTLHSLLNLCGNTKKNGGGCHNSKRVDKLQDLINILQNPPHNLQDTPDFLAWCEEQYLGAAITCSRIEGCRKAIDANTTCKEIASGKGHKYCLLAVEVTEVKEHTIKSEKNYGALMGFINVADKTGELNTVIFPEQWSKYGHMFYTGNTLLLDVISQKQNSSPIINQAWQI